MMCIAYCILKEKLFLHIIPTVKILKTVMFAMGTTIGSVGNAR